MIRDPGFFVRNAWLIPFLPLLGAVVAAIGARRLESPAHIPVIAGIGLAFLFSLGTLAAAGPDVEMDGDELADRPAISTSRSRCGSTG